MANTGDVWLFNTDLDGDVTILGSAVTAGPSIFMQAGEPLALAGEPFAQAGNFLLGGSSGAINGDIQTTDGHETAVYLSLWGGNKTDSTLPSDRGTWWGNAEEDQAPRAVRSRTQFLVDSLPATPLNLRRVEDAVASDLSWIDGRVEVSASIPALNRLQLDISIDGNQFSLFETWAAAQAT